MPGDHTKVARRGAVERTEAARCGGAVQWCGAVVRWNAPRWCAGDARRTAPPPSWRCGYAVVRCASIACFIPAASSWRRTS
ncbi:hypothetical protein, partial [Streptomyces leeuwenhoekii]|uniref:hypothetical protein n=1 Tax=Streptomyces leeuwenhoekii TaxID=1437453 RepID=UPI001C708D40